MVGILGFFGAGDGTKEISKIPRGKPFLRFDKLYFFLFFLFFKKKATKPLIHEDIEVE